MVKNHHVTFVDGLEAWGFEKDRLELLAGELRRLFGVSAAVGVRSGTEDNLSKGRKQLWSLKLGGKLSDEVKGALAARGVDNVKLPPKKKGKRK
jgi:translation initiation factor 1 (eIF-1/SUI1)